MRKNKTGFDLTIKGTGQVVTRLRMSQRPILTQGALADRVGCLTSDISRYESNQIGIPFSRIVKIAEVFQLSPAQFLAECLAFAKGAGVPLDKYERIKKAGSPGEGT